MRTAAVLVHSLHCHTLVAAGCLQRWWPPHRRCQQHCNPLPQLLNMCAQYPLEALVCRCVLERVRVLLEQRATVA